MLKTSCFYLGCYCFYFITKKKKSRYREIYCPETQFKIKPELKSKVFQ